MKKKRTHILTIVYNIMHKKNVIFNIPFDTPAPARLLMTRTIAVDLFAKKISRRIRKRICDPKSRANPKSSGPDILHFFSPAYQ